MIAELRLQKPGVIAKMPCKSSTQAHGAATALRKGRVRGVDPNELEQVQVREHEDGNVFLYVKLKS